MVYVDFQTIISQVKINKINDLMNSKSDAIN